ncbi:hypothetical protein O181_004903 [Austropuccinia psidii MF-1]|uniref:Uncharacterized protein n=1 Tax=Austropuccinia psidii MF-1 TaxID=1389203 RepID=A0A9Q3GF12_9BASI|nr:hypothetical protein [Austropuccinia psidii MF-1]
MIVSTIFKILVHFIYFLNPNSFFSDKKAPEGIHQSTSPTPPLQNTSSKHQSSSPKVGGQSKIPPIPSGTINQTQSPSLREAYPPIPSATCLYQKPSSPKVAGPPNMPEIPNPLNRVQIRPLVTYSSSGSDYHQSQPAGRAKLDQFEAFFQREEAHIQEEYSRTHPQVGKASGQSKRYNGRVSFDESLKHGPRSSSSLKGKSSILENNSVQISTRDPSPNLRIPMETTMPEILTSTNSWPIPVQILNAEVPGRKMI